MVSESPRFHFRRARIDQGTKTQLKEEHFDWEDYNPKLLSKGGGVFKRSAKSLKLSPQIRQALAIEAESLTPNELIHLLLKAPVDLLWNGGIGTYVKGSHESHNDVGDRANDIESLNKRCLSLKLFEASGLGSKKICS